MKTCPVCSETYSERIDFCFSDGAVLTLLPSALDAPVPRMVAQQAAEATAGRLRTERTEEIEPPTSDAPPPPRPASADEAPAPRAITEESLAAAAAASEAAAYGGAPVPPVPVAPPVVKVIEPPLPVFDDLDIQAGRLPGEPRGTPLMWFLGAAAGVLCVVLLGWWLGSGSSPKAPTRPVTAAEPAPVTRVEARPAVPEPVAAEPPAQIEPEPAPSPVEATPAPAQRVEPTPRRTSTESPSNKPATASNSTGNSSSSTSAIGTATQVGSRIAPPVRVGAAAAPVADPGTSPWDAPTEPRDATASFTSDPVGAIVRVDGRLRGKTPLDVKLPLGRHEVTLELDGYTPLTKTVDVAVEAPKFPFTLKPVVRSGNVLVVASGWDGATLIVDGETKGQLPTQVMLTEGAHTFQVVQGDRRAKEQRVVQLAERGLTRVSLDPR